MTRSKQFVIPFQTKLLFTQRGNYEKGNEQNVYFISRHLPGESKKERKELLKEIETNNSGTGWAGDAVESEWADAILSSIKKKKTKLSMEGFKRFDEDWLLIYDNWSLPALDRQKAALFLWNLITESDITEGVSIQDATSKKGYYIFRVVNHREKKVRCYFFNSEDHFYEKIYARAGKVSNWHKGPDSGEFDWYCK